MKKIVLISILLVIVTSMTSCLTMLSVLLDDDETATSTQADTAKTDTAVITEAPPKPRAEKDAYDTSKKLDCIAVGALIQIPDYFNLSNTSKAELRVYSAESGKARAYISIIGNTVENYSQSEFENDFTTNELQNAFINGANYKNSEILNTEILNICDQKCCLFNYKATDKATNLNISASTFFIYIERTNSLLCVCLIQSDNSNFTYNNDFKKIINSIKLLSEDEEKNSHEHNYTYTISKAATCVSEGKKTLTCQICFETHEETIPVTDQHKYTSQIVKSPTCKDPGVKKYVCSLCGHEYTEAIPVTSIHTYSEWKETKSATSKETGTKERTCTICGNKQTEAIPKLAPVNLPKSTLTNNAIKINKQQTVTVSDYCEFTIESIDITDDVLPPKKSGVYSHYQAYDGKIYVDVCMKYKNIESKKISADEVFRAYLVFSNIYEYSGFITVEEDDRSDFTYANITSIAPLSSVYLHVLFEASNLIKTTNGSLSAVFQINGKSYVVNIRDGSTDTVDTSDGYKQKTSGSIEKGEKIAIPGKCEFYVESINITSAVKPPKATGYYLYYKADEGNKYIDICFCFKNTGNQNLGADNAIKSAKFTYKGKYEYSASGCIEEKGRSEFTYLLITNIKPLCYEYIHVMFEVPDEVANNVTGIPVSFVINGATYSVTIK